MGVKIVRRFELTRIELGVHALDGSWFVYDRDFGSDWWRLHGGPYASFEQARDWVLAIQESDL